MNRILVFLKKAYRRTHLRLLILWRQNKTRFFYFSIKKRGLKIHVNETYEKHVRWTLRVLVAIGIGSSVFAFPEWYYNLLLAISLLLVEQLLEKTIYIETALFVSAIPEYETEDWKGMIWVFQKTPTRKYFEVGMYFSSREAAERIFPVILHWSKYGNDDSANLVRISVVKSIRANDYHVYIYADTENDPAFLAIKKEREEASPDREHHVESLSIMFCKGFDYSTSAFPHFEKIYSPGDTYYFYAYVIENGQPKRLDHLGFLVKKDLKIKNQENLGRKDREYEHMKFVVDREEYSKEPPPPSMFFEAVKRTDS